MCRWLRYFWRACLLSRLNGLWLGEVDCPELPGDDWVRLRTIMGGICGTDMGLLTQKQPPNSILQSFSSMPMILGHESVAVVDQIAPSVNESWLGRRVCVEPTLCCQVRGIDPPCPHCREGMFGNCLNFSASLEGKYHLPAGTSIGYNSRTGGSFGEYFVAHQSQLVPVPDEIPDELAVLTDPVACSLHAVGRANLSEARRILVYGTGALGLGIVASLRALGYRRHIDALDRHEHLGQLAREFGADEFFCLTDRRAERFEAIARRTGASVQRAKFGNYMLSGGYDVIFDCVGSRASINESLKWARARGQVVFVATGHGGSIDLTPVWFTELNIVGAYGRQLEEFAGRRIGTYQLVHELMLDGKLNVAKMLTHTFTLSQYRRAFSTAWAKARNKAVKVAFDFRGGRANGERE